MRRTHQGGRSVGGRARLALATLLLAACTSVSAFADTYDSAVARGIAAKERALETNRTSDWEEALELFAAAISLNPTKEAEFEFAEAAAQLHLDDEAFDAYRTALAQGLSGRAAERAQQFVDARVHAFATLDVQGPAGARLYVNGRKRAVLPLARPLTVSAGAARLNVDAQGFRAWEREISLQPGQTRQLEVALEPEAKPTPTPAPLAPPAAKTPVPPRRTAPAPAPPARTWEVPTLIVGGGLTLLGATGIIVTSVLLPDRRETLKSNCALLRGDDCRATTSSHVQAAQSAADDIVTFERLRWASVGVAAVGLGAVAASVWRLSGRAAPKAATNGSVQVSRREVQVLWTGDFD